MKAIVFDALEWNKTGDIGNNVKFWKEATIIRERLSKDNEVLVDVVFNDGRISNGHFKSGIKEIK